VEQVQLHPIDGERAPHGPRRAVEFRGPFDLPGVQNRQQRGVHEEGFRVPREHFAPQRLQEAPALVYPPVQRGRRKADDPREEVREELREELREEPLGAAQEGALALHAPKLLQECQRQELLRVRELLERCVLAVGPGVEEAVSVVDEAENSTALTASSRDAGVGVSLGRAIRGSFRRGFG
jgi:hypothetical protein